MNEKSKEHHLRDHDTCVNSVKALPQNGGRLIDTAYMYGNEEAVGEGVRQAVEELAKRAGMAQNVHTRARTYYHFSFGEVEGTTGQQKLILRWI